MTHTVAAQEKIATLPPHRRKKKSKDTVRGLLIWAAVILVRLKLYTDMPLWVFALGITAGAIAIDEEWVKLKGAVVIGFVRDFFNAKSGNGGAS